MYECPNCKQKVIPFSKKFLTGPLLHYHCTSCNASLSCSWTIIAFLVVLGAQPLVFTILSVPVSLMIIIGLLSFLATMYYWIFHSKIVVKSSGNCSSKVS